MRKPELQRAPIAEFSEEDFEHGRTFKDRVRKATQELVVAEGERLGILVGFVRYHPRVGHAMHLVPKGPVRDIRKGYDRFAREVHASEEVVIDPIRIRYLDVMVPSMRYGDDLLAEARVDFDSEDRLGEVVLNAERKIQFLLDEHSIAIVEEEPPHGVEIT